MDGPTINTGGRRVDVELGVSRMTDLTKLRRQCAEVMGYKVRVDDNRAEPRVYLMDMSATMLRPPIDKLWQPDKDDSQKEEIYAHLLAHGCSILTAADMTTIYWPESDEREDDSFTDENRAVRLMRAVVAVGEK